MTTLSLWAACLYVRAVRLLFFFSSCFFVLLFYRHVGEAPCLVGETGGMSSSGHCVQSPISGREQGFPLLQIKLQKKTEISFWSHYWPGGWTVTSKFYNLGSAPPRFFAKMLFRVAKLPWCPHMVDTKYGQKIGYGTLGEGSSYFDHGAAPLSGGIMRSGPVHDTPTHTHMWVVLQNGTKVWAWIVDFQYSLHGVQFPPQVCRTKKEICSSQKCMNVKDQKRRWWCKPKAFQLHLFLILARWTSVLICLWGAGLAAVPVPLFLPFLFFYGCRGCQC